MYLIPAFIAWSLAQIIKVIINLITGREISLAVAFGSGGMPSSHSSTVCRLATAIAIREGFMSTTFSIAAVLAIIVMYDAMGVRRETGNQGKIINEMISIFNDMGRDLPVDKKFKELVGHSPLQVLFGAILGCVVGAAFCYLFFPAV